MNQVGQKMTKGGGAAHLEDEKRNATGEKKQLHPANSQKKTKVGQKIQNHQQIKYKTS